MLTSVCKEHIQMISVPNSEDSNKSWLTVQALGSGNPWTCSQAGPLWRRFTWNFVTFGYAGVDFPHSYCRDLKCTLTSWAPFLFSFPIPLPHSHFSTHLPHSCIPDKPPVFTSVTKALPSQWCMIGWILAVHCLSSVTPSLLWPLSFPLLTQAGLLVGPGLLILLFPIL
jgi:hypothetical protein